VSAADTPTEARIAIEAARAACARVHTQGQAQIVTYDRDSQRATVKMCVQGKRVDPDTGAIESYDLPEIPNVPVRWLRAKGGASSITDDLERGDVGTVHFFERSHDEWKAQGGTGIEAADPRRHDLFDAIFVPGGSPFNAPIPADGVHASAMVIRAQAIKLGSSAASLAVARQTDPVQVTFSAADIATLATALLATTAFVATGAWPIPPPAPPFVPVTVSGEITGGSPSIDAE